MKLTPNTIPIYTIAGEGTSRPLPEWLARKRKRSLKKDPEWSKRIELLQDFEFEEASCCVRCSADGEWVISTGTYKPQIHTHYLPHLSLSYARHTNTVNQSFVLLSQDYTKSLHLQSDRSLEFHTPGGLHYATRIPRYGRDIKYNARSAEALVPAVGVNADGWGEVFRLNLEMGLFVRGFEVDVGGDDLTSSGAGALQGGIAAGAVNCAAVAEESHGLLAFGTSKGTVEFWDGRTRNRVSVIKPPIQSSLLDTGQDLSHPEITALDFHPSGLHLATGSSEGIVQTYDLRSPAPLLQKDNGYGARVQRLQYLTTTSSSVHPDILLSSDKKQLRLYDLSPNTTNGELWTSIEPAVDLNHIEWVPDSGMFLSANEGRQQHAFFVPQLGPAPRWCGFLDRLVEEMEEDDPNAGGDKSRAGEVYDNYKFVSRSDLASLHLDHLVGSEHAGVLRPYMHGYFVPQRLYEQARLLANPDLAIEQRQKSVQAKIEKERESRIRGNKKVAVKVNRRLAEKLAAREEANERRRAERLLRRGEGESAKVEAEKEDMEPRADGAKSKKSTTDLIADPRFQRLFEDEEFEIDEASREFQAHNPSTAAAAANINGRERRQLTAAEEEELQDGRAGSSSHENDEDDDEESTLPQRTRNTIDEDDRSKGRVGSSSYKKSGHRPQQKRLVGATGKGPKMQVSTSSNTANKSAKKASTGDGRSFGDLAASRKSNGRSAGGGGAVARDSGGSKSVSFTPLPVGKGKRENRDGGGGVERREPAGRKGGNKERRSASGNAFRRM